MYHRIAVESFDPWGLAVSPENFADQLEWLGRHRLVLPLPEFAIMAREKRLPRHALAITFDDGYACNAAIAAPLLERMGLPATIFLSPALIERHSEFWWDELERIVLEHPGCALRLDGAAVPLGSCEAGDRKWPPGEGPRTARQDAFLRLWAQLRTRSPATLDKAMRELRAQAPLAARARLSHRPMTPAEARNLGRSRIDVGSHTLTHPSLPALKPADKASEIIDSVERCANVTGIRPRSFAYPYGDHDAEAEQLVEAAGFVCACTTRQASLGRLSRQFALPRLQVRDWAAPTLARTLAAS